MKPTPYLKRLLKELDGELRKFPRAERTRALDAYKQGLEISFHFCYPERFSSVSEVPVDERYGNAYSEGNSVGGQFGELEVDYARQFLLEEVEKRKTKYSKPGLIGRLFGGR